MRWPSGMYLHPDKGLVLSHVRFVKNGHVVIRRLPAAVLLVFLKPMCTNVATDYRYPVV